MGSSSRAEATSAVGLDIVLSQHLQSEGHFGVDDSPFIFIVCQRGAEAALKAELAQQHPELNLAFSRPGFVTFKLQNAKWPENFVLRSTFARTYGWSIARLTGDHSSALIEELIARAPEWQPDQLHVWERDSGLPGSQGFEPFASDLAATLGEQIQEAWRAARGVRVNLNHPAHPHQKILDVIVVDPNCWWLGWHVGSSIANRWVGGVPPLERDPDVISRAYYKLAEALEWSQLPLRSGDLVLELGSSPGGASACLLERGASVFAVDPAEMAPEVAEHPQLWHLQMRSKDVPKKDVREARWLVSDLNVAPNYTLDAVEEFVKSQHLHLRGLVLTLKLADWSLASDLDSWRQRVKAWGFDVVKTRQLAFNRRELCLFAVKDRMDVRAGAKRQKGRRPRTGAPPESPTPPNIPTESPSSAGPEASSNGE